MLANVCKQFLLNGPFAAKVCKQSQTDIKVVREANKNGGQVLTGLKADCKELRIEVILPFNIITCTCAS